MRRIAVVTGASSGIGAALVRRLQAEGWLVVGLQRRPSKTDEYEECDVADRASVEAAAQRVLGRHPHVDLVVCNAGVAARSNYLDGNVEAIERVMSVNYFGAVWTVLAFLPGLGRGSHVVNVVSVAGTVAGGPYSASKHAQLAFSRSLARELAPRGVFVNTVNPGFVETAGFPQQGRLGKLSRFVVEPQFVAGRIVAAVARERREIFVPSWYRPFAWGQALVPGLIAGLPGPKRSKPPQSS